MADAKKGRREAMKRGHRRSKEEGNGDENNPKQDTKSKMSKNEESPTPRRALRSIIFSCKNQQHQQESEGKKKKKKSRKLGCSGSLCSIKDNPGVPTTNNTSSRSLKPPLSELRASSNSSNSSISFNASSSSTSSLAVSLRGVHLRRFSGCYECHAVVDPSLGVSRVHSMRATINPCPDCGEVFIKPESLELHQAARHAVSELSPEDTSRNIVEIIFQSSWLKKQVSACKIDRILKVHNTQRTISRFEDYRDSIKASAKELPKKHPRCIADGNELLRFHCTAFKCSLGLNGSSNLCDSIPHCSVCSIIRDGFKMDRMGRIRTMATSGRAHDAAAAAAATQVETGGGRRAMLVCRVIAGRVKKNQDGVDEGDSIPGSPVGIYSNLDELFVFNPRAILPCFVVIYNFS